jgi:uncharacterized protein YcbK (DUF882 family)
MRFRRTPVLLLVAAAVLVPGPADAQAPAVPTIAAAASGESPRSVARDARFFGHSGALRAVVVPATGEVPHPLLTAIHAVEGEPVRWEGILRGSDARLLGEPAAAGPADQLLGEAIAREGLVAPQEPGIWKLVAEPGGGLPAQPEIAVITQVPFTHKSNGVLNGYRIGRYSTEGAARSDIYAPPSGFIEVTRENQNFYISRHFQLRQFLTKNQPDVWPKYLALDLRLIDKLELVLQELNAMGVRADRMHVMSGFRTPEYNGPGSGGRAALSRHTYGDAADVWVDNDGNGYMDDLNGDGVVDIRDAQVMLRAVERVERKFPELVGGAGLYTATGAHGPFIHIDVRGAPARW